MDKVELRTLAEALGELINAYRILTGKRPMAPFVGFAVDCGTPALVEHIILQAKAVCLLAESSQDFAPVAAACARSAMEVGALVAWLAKPQDSYEREGRWLGYFKSLEDFYRKQAKELKTRDPKESKEAQEILSSDLKKMSAPRFGRNIVPVSKPSLKDMMIDLGYEHLYTSYRELCELIHGGPETISRHRAPYRSLSIPFGFEFGLFSNNKLDWQIIFKATGWGVGVSAYHSSLNLGFNNSKCANLLNAHKRLEALVGQLK